MQVLEAIFLGLLQGITEWLPISSSGHLAIAQYYFNINAPIFFDVLLHLGTVLVILFFFRKEILQMFKDFPKNKLLLYLIIATIPIAIIGYFFQSQIESLFSNMTAIGICFLFTAFLLFISEKFPDNKPLKLKESIIIGVSQAIAIFPGVSRSGTTISTGLLLGVEKKQLLAFSFLLAVPAIIGATILEFPQANFEPSYLYGFLIAIISGYITLKILKRIILTNKFHYFSYYCLILGTILLLV